MSKQETSRTTNFNYRLARYFFNNHRLMILSLFFIVVLGIASVMSLKTTGFPEASVNIVLIQTTYPGAAADTISRDITQPLEGAIKDIDGISKYESRSVNGASLITASVEENEDPNDVRSEIEAATGTVTLPEEATTPEITVGEYEEADIILSIADTDLKKIYDLNEKINTAITEIPETTKVTPLRPIQRLLVVKIDTKKLAANGLSQSAIEQQLKSIGETIPVVGNVSVNKENQTITTTLKKSKLSTVKKFVVGTQPNGTSIILDDVADLSIEYRFTDNITPHIGIRAGEKTAVLPALTLQISAASGTNLAEYTEEVDQLLNEYEEATFVTAGNEQIPDKKTLIIQHYTSNQFNEQQVEEVISGLIGGTLPIDSSFAKIGWILGGVQLVFLVMLAFVSWRAAIVSTLAIPLSLVFSTIYLYFIGEDLNTLVLFSLVLVIGLVVDPTLVILESIQRKIDIGLKGKKAALAAVADVGPGLFLASLTNIIVFIPFGVISGVLGQIFAYIPLTVIPAIIGSYVIPLIFLGWIGGLFLRKSATSSEDEEKNLWRVSRWVMNINNRLLHGSVIVRMMVIVIAIILPLVVTGYYFQTKQVTMVQFSSSENADFLQINGAYKTTTPQPEREQLEQSIIKTALQNSDVQQIYPLTDSFQYFVNLTPARERDDYRSTEINDDVETVFEEKELGKKMFDLTIHVNSIGPPRARYEVALAVSGAEFETLQDASVEVGKTMEKLCEVDGSFEIQEDCSGNRVVTKVDDGLTDQANRVIEIVLDRNKLTQQELLIPDAPLSVLVNQFIRQYFAQGVTTPLTTIQLAGQDTDVVIESQLKRPKKIKQIKNIPLLETPFLTVRVKDLATVRKTTAPLSIRRTNGQTISVVQARVAEEYTDQTTVAKITQTVIDYYKEDEGKRLKEMGLPEEGIETYSEGDSAAAARSFQELFTALILAIAISYIVLAIFFKSFTSPLVILFSVPLSFLGIFPALAHLSTGQFGFLEIIGLIILIGIVENVAIFLIDAANQKMEEEGWDEKRAIAYASGVRLRPVLLTKFTALASLAPLAFLSETYRPISIVIMFGLLTSGITSLFTTPILYIFFRWLSHHFYTSKWWHKIFFFPLAPFYMIGWWIKDHKKKNG